jgi:ABC-type lipopolysaccharide export system ATPase subunit
LAAYEYITQEANMFYLLKLIKLILVVSGVTWAEAEIRDYKTKEELEAIQIHQMRKALASMFK